MGHHYVPQKYLRGFAVPSQPDFIWMYDKKNASRKKLPISRVAQEADFYTDFVEVALNEFVEKPANLIFNRIREGGSLTLTDAERATLTVYIGTMLKRVPRYRKDAHAKVPQVLADTVRKLKEHIEHLGREGKLDASQVAKRLAEADDAESKFQKDPPTNVVEIIETPWPSGGWLNAIYSMEWRFLLVGSGPCFITSDNPAYFFSAFGLATENSELVFPLSTVLALHCSWQRSGGRGLLRATEPCVREFNNRVASGADRFLFYKDSREWVLEASKVTAEQLNRINW